MRIRFFTLVVVVLLAACTQGENEPCQDDRDCDDGLVCTEEDTELDRGFCQKPQNVKPMSNDRDSGDGPLKPDPDSGLDGAVDGAIDGGDGSAGDASVDADASVDPDMDAG